DAGIAGEDFAEDLPDHRRIVDDQHPARLHQFHSNSSTPPVTGALDRRARTADSVAATSASCACGSRCTTTRPLSAKNQILRGWMPHRSSARIGMRSACRYWRTNSALRVPTGLLVKPFSTLAPPNTLASRRLRCA